MGVFRTRGVRRPTVLRVRLAGDCEVESCELLDVQLAALAIGDEQDAASVAIGFFDLGHHFRQRQGCELQRRQDYVVERIHIVVVQHDSIGWQQLRLLPLEGLRRCCLIRHGSRSRKLSCCC